MYLIQYNEVGIADRIVVEPEKGLNGTYVNELPIALDRLLELKAIERSVDDSNIYYINK